MSIKEQVRRRLAVGLAGVVLASALVVGVAPVAADDDTVEPRDVNVGMEATGLASNTRVTITEVVAPPAASNNSMVAPTTPIVAEPGDHRD